MNTTLETSLAERISAVRARRVTEGRPALPKSGWQTVAGTVEDDAHFREAARLGELWRKEQNQRQ